MKKILFIASHREDRAPNQRFRFEQYISFLNQNGFDCTISPLIASPKEDKTFYSGSLLAKILLGTKLTIRRFKDVFRANQFDIIFIAREAFITGSIFFEKQLKKSNTKIIFDFDDSIWLNVISSNNKKLSWLKDGSKTGKIIQLSDLVFAGNDFLATYARRYNPHVVIVPTTIDTDAYLPNYKPQREKITIGWSGSVSTIEHFQHAIPALKILKDKFKNKIEIKVIGDSHFENKELGIQGLAWKSESEIKDLQSIDIGIMPLPDNEWTWGKCGLKGLQYMALEIPTIMSPVGVNKEIIKHGVNGFLANTTEEWVTIISTLIEKPDLRRSIGIEGRKTVVERYSVQSLKNRYLDQFKSVTGS